MSNTPPSGTARTGTSPSGAPPEEGRSERHPLTERVAGWSARHAKKTILGWFLLVVVCVVAGGAAGSGAKTSDAGESGRGQRIMREQDKKDVNFRENILIEDKHRAQPLQGNAKLEAVAKDVAAQLRADSGVVKDVAAPGDSPEAAKQLISKDGKSGLVTAVIPGPAGPDADKRLFALEDKVEELQKQHPDARVAMAGELSLDVAISDAADKDLGQAEMLSLPVTLVILLVVFGALVAASVPVLLAVSAVAAALGVVSVIGTVIPANSTVSSVVLLIGMAVGVDYSLFYLRREREERAAGKLPKEALRISARTSGHAVIVSGLTVMLSMCGLLIVGVDVFNGMAMGTIVVVGLAVLGSVTVLPAMLALLGRRVDALRLPFLGRRRTQATESRSWAATARAVVRRPLLLGGVALLALGALSVPALHLKLSEPGSLNSLPRSIDTVDAGIRLQQAFPGGASPAQVVVWGEGATTGEADKVVEVLRQKAAESDLLGEPITAQKVDKVLSISVPLAGKGTDAKSTQALHSLRRDVLPQAFEGTEGLHYATTGEVAGKQDLADVLEQRQLWVIGFVLLLALVTLILAFRAPLVAVVSVILNLLSIGAAYGVVVLGFQDGHLAGLLNFQSSGGVVNWLPLFMFAILFGLSMDYHVFILSRIRERWRNGEDARTAVVRGVAGSAGVITSAAAVMIAVFALFATLSAVEFKMLGVGMAAAILIDATLVRGVLLPAALTLLGERAWGKRPAAAAPSPDASSGAPSPSGAESGDSLTLTRKH
ncbi:MMPL family transporter [Streptomyces sp. ODS28]|uniref:MMPL family transporter n=1 Tax=Streptomyces sp. ODS28 TaxID=3136688 RepID=UPI0031EF875F